MVRLKHGDQEFDLVIDLTVDETIQLEDDLGRDAATWTSTVTGIARCWATLRRNGVMYTVEDVKKAADAGELTMILPGINDASDPQRAEEASEGDVTGATGEAATGSGSAA